MYLAIPSEYLEAGYQALREHRRQAEVNLSISSVETRSLSQNEVPGVCIRVLANHDQEEQVVELFTRYLQTWLDLLRQAQPASPEIQHQVQKGVETLVNGLLEQGGPAVDFLKLLVGTEQQHRRIKTVSFGVDA